MCIVIVEAPCHLENVTLEFMCLKSFRSEYTQTHCYQLFNKHGGNSTESLNFYLYRSLLVGIPLLIESNVPLIYVFRGLWKLSDRKEVKENKTH